MEKLALNITEAAEAIGVSRQVMAKIIHMEGFPVKKIDGKYLISVAALNRWLES